MRTLLLLFGMAAAAAKKILVLHGSGGSAGAFLARLSPVRSATAASYKDWRPTAFSYSAIDAPSGEGTWWTYPAGERSFTASSYEGAEESIDAVEKAIVEGDFVGLLGFSQGAMLAAIVAARATLGEGPKLPLQFAIMCGGAMPNPYRPLLDRLRQRGEVGVQPPDSVLPTLHCISESDRVNPVELGRELATCFAPHAEILYHDAGHQLPPANSLQPLAAFVDRWSQ